MKIKNILVATDFSASSDYAISRAIEIAKLTDAKLTIMHALQKKPFDEFVDTVCSHILPKSFWSTIVEQKEKLLQSKVSTLSSQHHLNIHAHVVCRGKPAIEILDYCNHNQIDLLVMGAHGKYSLRETYIGTTAEYIADFTTCPVLVVKNTPMGSYQRILIPVDFTDVCKDAVSYAAFLYPNTNLSLLNVVNNEYEEFIKDNKVADDVLNEQLQEMRQQLLDSSCHKMEEFIENCPCSISKECYQIKIGYPGPTIISDASELGSDLIVMGTQSNTQAYCMNFGSVANFVLTETEKDTLLVPA